MTKLQGLLTASGMPLPDLLKIPEVQTTLGRSCGKIQAFSDMMDDLATIRDQVPLKELITQLLEKSGYLEASGRKIPTRPRAGWKTSANLSGLPMNLPRTGTKKKIRPWKTS